ncbi:MAG: ATP-binding cassette domain-containing protein [Limnochordales bacterium]|nr:ATP-binding cassette domain-containing protein [Limnochordales bacterium]
MAPTPILVIKELSLSLGGRRVLENVGFALHPGEFMAVIGPNGAGKTSLLRVIAGLEKHFTGLVDRRQLPHGSIGYLPQIRAFNSQLPLTVTDLLATRLRGMKGVWMTRDREPMRGLPSPSLFSSLGSEAERLIGEALERVGLAGFENRLFSELSGGQQQRVLLARALLGPVRLLLLDEPESGLDPEAQEQFYKLVRDLTRKGDLACLAVSHHLHATAQAADTCLLLNRRVLAFGPASEITQRYFQR